MVKAVENGKLHQPRLPMLLRMADMLGLRDLAALTGDQSLPVATLVRSNAAIGQPVGTVGNVGRQSSQDSCARAGIGVGSWSRVDSLRQLKVGVVRGQAMQCLAVQGAHHTQQVAWRHV